MNQQRLMKIILAPVISEKSSFLADKRGQMAFRVLPNASKPEIKAAVELLFGTEVVAVNTVLSKGKKKRFGKIFGQRKTVKKAYVKLADGQDLNVGAIAADTVRE